MFDIAIIGGTVIDPQEQTLTPANVYVKGGKITEIAQEAYDAADVIEANGLYVSPGFIDIHTHTESSPFVGEMLARQGVTTVVGGNCGMGQPNLPEFFIKTQESGFIVNQSELTGATTLRERAGQTDPYAPLDTAQLEHAEALLLADLKAGASGLSFGLEYVPGSSWEEVERLSRVAARCGKPVAVHIRADCEAGLSALREALNIARVTGAGVIISHVVYQFGFGMMRQALDIIGEAVREGLDVSCDSGMYTSFATLIGSAVFDEGCLEKWGCSYGDIYMSSGAYAGQFLTKETFEKARAESPDGVAVAKVGNAYEIMMAFELPYMMCSSDAGVSSIAGAEGVAVHPQDAGTFARFLREAVVKTKKLTLADAVSRITALPARRMGLSGKGRLTPGADADIAVFDLDRVRDCSVFPDAGRADAAPEGFRAVVVNGRVAVRNGIIECANAGKILRALNKPKEESI
jgi:N-acyl-D-amino-acid deacylase